MMENQSAVVGDRLVQRSLLGNQIADALRREILLGVIKPGTRLSQQQLCERFGTSRMPVRDGLRVLSHEGLLLTDAGQHTIVAPISRADFLDAYLIEGMLAGLAATRASKNATRPDIDALTDLHDAMLAAAAAGDHAQMVQLNWTFHRTINRLAQSRKLLAAIKSVSLDLPKDFLAELPEWSDRSNAEHAEVLEAMAAGRHKAAGTLMTAHIVDSGKGLIEFLEVRGLKFG
jgi:DNA-binding GntR family transcriptional regulator